MTTNKQQPQFVGVVMRGNAVDPHREIERSAPLSRNDAMQHAMSLCVELCRTDQYHYWAVRQVREA